MRADYLESIDIAIVKAINGLHNPFLDEFMWIVSMKYTWIPLYILLIFLYTRKTNMIRGLIFFFVAIISVVLSDQISVHLFKDFFQRYRPSHNILLTGKLHFYMFENGDYYRGGTYGFVSSHAANCFAVFTFAYLALREFYSKLFIPLIFFGILICLSRIYLGVHYLSDVFVGSILGILIAIMSYCLFIIIISSSKVK